MKTILSQLKKQAISIDFSETKGEALPIGISKFGGQPDVPENFSWYYYEGEGMDGITKNRPLSFLAQINCEEMKKYDLENQLPSSGILYFFYELDTMTWGFDPNDAGSAKAYYYNGDMSKLQRNAFPFDLERDYQLPELKIAFSNKEGVPSFEEFIADYDYTYSDWEEYEQAITALGYEQEYEYHKMLGYADPIQGEMRMECELATNGIYSGSEIKMEPNKHEQMQQNSKQWQLLFQLSTVSSADFELMFGDCGSIYFYIKKEDLQNCQFDNVWCILQCS